MVSLKSLAFLFLAAGTALAAPADDLPTVDLGYEVHQALSFNSTTGIYKFSNIRFAQAPVGDLRFASPLPPQGRSEEVQRGELDVHCPQALPMFSIMGEMYKVAYVANTPFNLTQTVETYESAMENIPATIEGIFGDLVQSEDCLFLDVVVPEGVFKRADSGRGAAVMVWFFGGGNVSGHKTEDPSGLIEASQASGDDGIIWVSINYRLGTLGFSSGPKFQSEGGAPNAALLDQRLALEWVQEHIHKFGGDRDRVTIFGISAGAGDVLHQVTAYGGEKPAPFKHALTMSQAFVPSVSTAGQDNMWATFLETANVSSLEEARALSSEAAILANTLSVGRSPYLYYGPAVDGDFVPEFAGTLLEKGNFAQGVKMMMSFVRNEYPTMSNPLVTDDEKYAEWFRTHFPGISDDVLAHLVNDLYPPVLDGPHGYDNTYDRMIQSGAEFFITCSTLFVDKALRNETHVFQFSVQTEGAPQAVHADDKPYLYYPNTDAKVRDVDIALAYQEYVTSFALTGTPVARNGPEFPMYGPDARILNFTLDGIVTATDPNANERCNWWQKGLFAPDAS
ncbi:hypothetical protein FQN52_007186 [Onygenales sp. PD_12]|nr:hypothetical protein FQN53_003078 [Emmonsiellopsis sp. PD_33]KAK2787468.1 hypothetical protein FQN52_007186 [Onygenales sp. PD_12]KAK2793462.1 hypothetical protein FQN51_001219 [Onygenales sp. PD_10]